MMVRRALFVCWSAVLIGGLLWSLAAPGVLLYRDMSVFDHMALHQSALGFGDVPARNAPQDGALALLGFVLPASWVARGLLLVGSVWGAWGAAAVAKHARAGVLGTLLALTVTLVNPFVVERLLQGQWSLVIAAWLLPGIAVWALTGRWRVLLPALWLASLTPTGAVVSTAVAVLLGRRWLIAVWGAALSAPWLIPSLLSPATALPAGGALFSARAEQWVGTVGAVLGLGGIWNSAAVPASRHSGWAVLGVMFFGIIVVFFRRIPRSLAVLGVLALVVTVVLAFVPDVAGLLSARVPGAALFRDSHKLLLFAIPAYVFLAAQVRPRALAVVALCAALGQVWDAPVAVEKLRPVPEPALLGELHAVAAGREVFVPELTTLTVIDGTPTAHPLPKAIAVVENGALTVDGVPVDYPSSRFVEAYQLWHRGDTAGLRGMGIDSIYADGQLTPIGDPQPPNWRWYLGLILLLGWLAMGVASALPLRQLGGSLPRCAPRKTPAP